MNYHVKLFSKAALGLLLTFSFSLIILNGFSQTQTPQSFSYQAVVRDAQGNIVQNQSVAFRFSILENSATGSVVYAETQAATTNNLGLVVLAIGNGSVLQGTFSTIQWGSALHFLKVELDINGSTNYVEMGTTQLMSVPYALYSENAGNVQTYTAGNGISITGNVIENTAPDQTVTITGTGSTTVTGTYPDFTINSTDNNTTYTAGNGIDVTGTTITNTAPDQTVLLNAGTGIGVTGTYPNFSIENTAPNQPVSLTGQGATTISGTYPNFTISSTDNNTTYTAGAGITLTGTEFSHTAHTGDVSGTTALTVTGIQGKAVSSTAPVANQVLQFNGTNWSPTQPSNLISAGNGLNYSGNTLNSVWTQTGNNIYNNNAGRVGIGMNTPTGKLTVQGDTSNVLFEVKDKNGYSVFVVYQDSVQVFVDASGAKTNKGSFAVNPKGQQKAFTTNYLRITPDSTRIYTQDTITGFGVRNIGSGSVTSYMQLTPSNYFIGHEAGSSITTGLYNSFFGYQTGEKNTTGNDNIFIGYKSGINNLIGNYNTFIGYESGYNNNITGCMGSCSSNNTFIGSLSGFNNDSGGDNTFIGSNSGYNVTTANSCVFIGKSAGYLTTTSSGNTYIGYSAGASNNSNSNTFVGYGVGQYVTSATHSCYFGVQSGSQGPGGTYNSYYGDNSGFYNTTGGNNAVFGYYAGYGTYNNAYNYNSFFGAQSGKATSTGSYNSAFGYHAGYTNTTGTYNTLIGYYADVSSSGLTNATAIGNGAAASASNQVVLGNGSVTTLYCQGAYAATTASAANVFVSSTGQIMRSTSSKRYKTNITTLELNTEQIYKLRPVSYNSLNASDDNNQRYFGLVAEEVANVLPDLVEFAKEKDVIKGSSSEKLIPDAVKYPMLSVLLLKEVQKHQDKILQLADKVQEQQKQMQEQQKQISDLQKEIEKLKSNNSNK